MRKCELEFKLFKNEVEWYTKIEAKRGKEKAVDSFNTLCKKFEKFKTWLTESLGTQHI